MNNSWYGLYKISQIWSYKGAGAFEDNLMAIYEFEYKYAMVNSKLNAHPQRKQNILNNLKAAFADSAKNVVGVLLKTFNNWLDNHALLDPDKWATQRTNEAKRLEDDGESNVLEGMLWEYERSINPNPKNHQIAPVEKRFDDFIQLAFANIENTPSFKSFLENIILPEQRAYLMNNLESDGLKEFNASSWKKFRSKQQAEKYIENLTLENVDLDELFFLFMPDFETFKNTLYNSISKYDVLQEMYKVLVFPAWRDHWVSQGIETTRKNVEKVYISLNSIDYSNMGNTSATINSALNTVHQSGSMLDYVEEETGEDDLKSVLDRLTNGFHNSDWDEELKEELSI